MRRLLFLALLSLTIPFLFSPGVASARTDTLGDLEITWDDPIFDVPNAYPGYQITKALQVKNNGSASYDLGVRVEKKEDPDHLADAIWVTLRKQDGADLYGGAVGTKHLSDLFAVSEVSLLTINGGDTHTYEMELTLDSGIGNDYQNRRTVFDFTLGFSGGEVVGPLGVAAGASTVGAVSTGGGEGGVVLGAALPITGGMALGLLGASLTLFCFGGLIKVWQKRLEASTIDKT